MGSNSHIAVQETSRTGHFIIDTARIQQQTDFDWQLPIQWLTQIFCQCEYSPKAISGHFSCSFTREINRLRLKGTLNFQVETECAICLSKLKLDLCAYIDTFMQPASDAVEYQDELTSEDLEIEYYNGTTLVLDDLLGDSILLELPMIPRCETACRQIEGLVTAAELDNREQTVDPRLKALANIKLSKEN